MKRKPEDCAKICMGPLCDGCPNFLAISTLDKTKGKVKEEQPPFELEEQVAPAMVNGSLLEGSFILTPKEFELIREPLQGAIKSATNNTINQLRKHMDKPEVIQEMIENILTVSKLSFKLDKL